MSKIILLPSAFNAEFNAEFEDYGCNFEHQMYMHAIHKELEKHGILVVWNREDSQEEKLNIQLTALGSRIL